MSQNKGHVDCDQAIRHLSSIISIVGLEEEIIDVLVLPANGWLDAITYETLNGVPVIFYHFDHLLTLDRVMFGAMILI